LQSKLKLVECVKLTVEIKCNQKIIKSDFKSNSKVYLVVCVLEYFIISLYWNPFQGKHDLFKSQSYFEILHFWIPIMNKQKKTTTRRKERWVGLGLY